MHTPVGLGGQGLLLLKHKLVSGGSLGKILMWLDGFVCSMLTFSSSSTFGQVSWTFWLSHFPWSGTIMRLFSPKWTRLIRGFRVSLGTFGFTRAWRWWNHVHGHLNCTENTLMVDAAESSAVSLINLALQQLLNPSAINTWSEILCNWFRLAHLFSQNLSVNVEIWISWSWIKLFSIYLLQ